MPALPLYSKDSFDNVQVVALQANSDTTVDVSVGSPDYAIIEAGSSVALYQQAQLVVLLARTRAATSEGTYLDSFFADFGFTRLQPVAATGDVTLSRDSSGAALVIPVGSQVVSTDGTQTYNLVADTNQAAYSASSNAYLMAANATSIDVTVQAVNVGSEGNQPIGGITLNSSITGINTVYNNAAFTNGLDDELDAAFRTRFVAYLNSLSRATELSIESAISNVQQGIQYSIQNNVDASGNFFPGNFVVTIDDGTGAPSASLIAAVDAALTAYQGNTISHSTLAPIVESANIALGFTVASGYTKATLTPIVTAAISSLVNSVGLGNTLTFTKISQAVYAASPGVATVYSVTLNGGTSDLVPTTPRYTIKIGTLNVGL